MTTTNRRLLMAANRPIDVLRKFTFDRTGGDANINTCTARIKRLRGNTIAWNQLVQNGNFANGITGWGLINSSSYTLKNNGIVIVRDSDDTSVSLYNGTIIKNTGHKYYLCFSAYSNDGARLTIRDYIKSNSYDIIYRKSLSSTLTKYSFIYTIPQEGSGDNNKMYFMFYDTNTHFIGNFNIFDLTLMFGAGNEPTSVEEFESMFPLDYYEYNAGELLSFNGDNIKAVGFNQWDEEWEFGALEGSNGLKFDDNTRIRTKNYIPILPNTQYYIKFPQFTPNNIGTICYYDANKNFINAGYPISSLPFVNTSARARYMLIAFYPTYGATYNHDICINISDPLRNGTYEPYVANTKDISFYKSIKDGQGNTLFPYGLLSAGSVYDEVIGNKAIKRIGVVDLGSLNWTIITTGTYNRFYSNGIASNVKTVSYYELPNIITANYKTVNFDIAYRANDNKSCSITDNSSGARGNVSIVDSQYNTAAAFKTAMQGVMLYYELAEPIEINIDEQNLEYPAYRTGTEELLPANGAVPTTTPALFDIRYKIGGRRN